MAKRPSRHKPPTDCMTIRLRVQGPGDKVPQEYEVLIKHHWTSDPDLAIHYTLDRRYTIYHRHTSCDLVGRIDTLPKARKLMKFFRVLADTHKVDLRETRPAVLADAFMQAARQGHSMSIKSLILHWRNEHNL